MTVRELMIDKGYATGRGNKCRCPSGKHADTNPSAIMNNNNVYCFSCARAYGIKFLESKFNVTLDKEGEDIPSSSRKEKQVLFRE